MRLIGEATSSRRGAWCKLNFSLHDSHFCDIASTLSSGHSVGVCGSSLSFPPDSSAAALAIILEVHPGQQRVAELGAGGSLCRGEGDVEGESKHETHGRLCALIPFKVDGDDEAWGWRGAWCGFGASAVPREVVKNCLEQAVDLDHVRPCVVPHVLLSTALYEHFVLHCALSVFVRAQLQKELWRALSFL